MGSSTYIWHLRGSREWCTQQHCHLQCPNAAMSPDAAQGIRDGEPCIPHDSHKATITAHRCRSRGHHLFKYHQTTIRVIPTNWDALGSTSWAPTLGGTLLSPDIHLEGLQGQLASHRQEDAKAQLLTAVTSHCMCHLMTHLHNPLIQVWALVGPMYANAGVHDMQGWVHMRGYMTYRVHAG